jgi:putative ABC transport system substrate-binding protein
MKRRQFIIFLGAAAASSSLWPLTARGQQSAMPVVGFLGVTSAAEWEKYVAGFRDGLKEAGFVDGRNVTIDYEWAEGRYDRLPAMAAAFAKRPVDTVPIAPPAVRAAKAATTTIPIVFFLGSDPVELKIFTNLSHPEGNITGATALANALGAKRLELLREVAPNSAAYSMIVNPTNQNAVPDTSDVSKAAARLGARLVVVNASKEATSMQPSASLSRRKSARCWSIPTHTSCRSASRSRRWPRTTRSPPYSICVSRSRMAAS